MIYVNFLIQYFRFMREFFNTSLKNLHTFGMDVYAYHLVEIEHASEVRECFRQIEDEIKKGKFLTLGGGSNLLFSNDYPGTILKNSVYGIDVLDESVDFITVRSASGENWDTFVEQCVRNSWFGLENLSLIPGTVGAAPIQNIGAYGSEAGDFIERVNVYLYDEKKEITISAEDCRFGYRDSIFKSGLKAKAFITSVEFKLHKKFTPNLKYKDVSEQFTGRNPDSVTAAELRVAVIGIRQRKLPDPAQIGNAGSFFKNPVITAEHFEKLKKDYPELTGYVTGDSVKISAAWLIDKTGWKGKSIGGAAVHSRQPLVLVNQNNAKPEDVITLKDSIKESILKTFGIQLQEEVNVV